MKDEPTERIDPARFRQGGPPADDAVTVWRPDGVHPAPPARGGDVPPSTRQMAPPGQGTASHAAPSPAAARGAGATLVLAAAALILVSVALGVYGRTHQATFFAFNLAGFSSGTAAKAWLATVSFLFALVQLWSAMVMYGRLRGPAWVGGLHRWSGRIAVLVSVPVAVHCLYALGFQTGGARVLVHSLVGCLFYGAFVAKMLVLQRKASPGWLLPVLGGLVFTGLTVLWLTAAVWFFTTKGLTF